MLAQSAGPWPSSTLSHRSNGTHGQSGGKDNDGLLAMSTSAGSVVILFIHFGTLKIPQHDPFQRLERETVLCIENTSRRHTRGG